MSDLSLNHEALDASNRVLGFLAGATSQSFNQIGYGFVEAGVISGLTKGAESALAFTGDGADGGDGAETSSFSSLGALLKGLQDSNTSAPAFAQPLEAGDIPADPSTVVYLDAAQADMDDQLAWFSSAQNLVNLEDSFSLPGSPSESSVLVESSSSLVSDLLSDLLARLTNSETAESELSGEKQAAIRDFLDSVGSDLDGSARDFFQSNVQGRVKAITGEAIDSLGIDALDPVIDPAQEFDYYGTSAELIQDTRDALSLSSVALPQIGPTTAWVRDDLLQRLEA
jgi:hypothetical protein